MNELKPCPFCGGEAIEVEYEADNSRHIRCGVCHSETTAMHISRPEEAVTTWNRRTPEPGTSVIRWTRYDGTQETLPKAGKIVFIIPIGMSMLPVTTIYNGAEWEINMTTPHDKKPCYMTKMPAKGDIWAYLPNPPEGMK